MEQIMDQRTKQKPFPTADELANLAAIDDGIAELMQEMKPGKIIPVQELPKTIPEDPINPAHYRKHPSGIECIEVTRHMNFNVGNAIKYLWRYMDKGDPIENLKKAQWYIDDEIRRLEGKR